MESVGTLAGAQGSPTAVSALYPEKKVILTPVAEIVTKNVTVITKGRTVTTAISHTGITAKREVIVRCITQRGGPTIIVAASTQIGTRTLAPGATAGTREDGTGGILDPGLIPAVAPLQRKADLTTTSPVERGNTKQDIWRNSPKTQFPTRVLKVTPPHC